MLSTLLILKKLNSFNQKSLVHRLVQEKKCVFFIIFFFNISPSILWSQEVKEFEDIEIHGKYKKLLHKVKIDKNEIEKLNPHDLGHLLQRVAGISMRSYGGLGGMKTISLRGLGGGHTKLLVNGLPNSNVQNGQTDYGLIQIDNIEKIEVNIGRSQHLCPISSQVYGSSILVETFENTFSDKTISAKSSSTLGSFGQKESFLALKKGGKSSFVSISGKYRQVDGDYPYTVKMGNSYLENTRRNNNLNEYFVNVGTGFKWKTDSIQGGQHIIKLNASSNGSNKQLPGAVILYNDYADEEMETQNHQIGGNYSFFQKAFKLKVFGVYHNKQLRYYDPTYNNLDGFIENKYNTSILSGGINALYKLNAFLFTLGTDIEKSQLQSNRVSLGVPSRIVNNSMFKVNYLHDYIELYGAVFNQFYTDHNQTQDHRNEYNRINAQIGINSGNKLSKHFEFYAWFKQSMRPPSFNELYYTQIGNTTLEPEDATQINIGATFNKTIRKTIIGTRFNVYNNFINNKILALPTKNLFVWSIKNVGKVNVIGSDFEFNLMHHFTKNLTFEAKGNFTYQEVKDRTHENSPTYSDQLAYTPKISSNGSISLMFKDFSWHSSVFHIGERYSLNQNINSNLVEAFTLFDTSLGYKFKIKSKNSIKAQIGVKNVFNTSYQFIRYFMMPGRNYFLKIAYEFN